MDELTHPHDHLFRAAFGRADVARHFFQRRLPDEVSDAIDWDSLQLVEASTVDENLNLRISDVLYHASFKDQHDVLIYVLAEHQSRCDRWMALRLLQYMGRIWERWHRDHPDAPHLPYLFPLVVYHGTEGWSAPDFEGLFPSPLVAVMQPYIPSFRYKLFNVGHQDDDALLQLRPELLALTLLLLKNARRPLFWSRAQWWATTFADVLAQPDGQRTFEMLWTYILHVVSEEPTAEIYDRLLKELPDKAQETLMTFAQQLQQRGHEQGLQEGRQEGLQEGRQEGQVALLLRMMKMRFGQLPDDVTARVKAASESQLQDMAERFARGDALDELLP